MFKRINILRNRFDKKVQNSYSENYKTTLTETKEALEKILHMDIPDGQH